MTLSVSDFEPLRHRDGPVEVVDRGGEFVDRADTAVAAGLDAAATPADVVVILLTQTATEYRRIAGRSVLAVESLEPGWRISVDDSVEPQAGDRIRTRGV